MPAHTTANSVIASAKRLMLFRHFCRNRSRIAEISVPAWPMPTHHTKLVMSKAQPIVEFSPHTPTPVPIKYDVVNTPRARNELLTRNAHFHQRGIPCSIGRHTLSVTSAKVGAPCTID